MRVLIAVHNFLPEPCFGAEHAAMRQAAELLRGGHRVALFYPGRRDAGEADLAAAGLAGAELCRVPGCGSRRQVVTSMGDRRVESAFGAALERCRPDVVLFHHLVRLSLGLPCIARRQGVPSVMVIHDHYLACPSYSLFAWDGPVCPGGSPRRCARCLFAERFGRRIPPGLHEAAAALIWWRARLVRRLLASVDAFIAPSRSVVRELAARHVPLGPVVVVPNGADAARRFSAHRRAPGDVRFGFLGAVRAKKGVGVLADAFAGPLSSSLTIRGFTDDQAMAAFRRTYPDCAATLERFDPSVATFYEQQDVVVVPSIWLENQPSVVAEALAHGRPVIASRIGGVPEMFDDEGGGWHVDAGDVEGLRSLVVRLQRDPSEVARTTARVGTWPTWADTTARTVDELERVIRRVSRVAR